MVQCDMIILFRWHFSTVGWIPDSRIHLGDLCIHLYGPKSFRTDLLAQSDINNKLALLQAGVPPLAQKSFWGDGIYPILSHLLSRVEGVNDNAGMTSVRISNEWSYGSTAMLFPFVKYRANLKLRKCADIAYYYIVATILRNIVCCLYGNVTCGYFERGEESFDDPTDFSIEHYLDPIHKLP